MAKTKKRNDISELTYVVEHNPNCPSPFLVRLPGPKQAVIDKKYYSETKDTLGFGKTFHAAAAAAIKAKEQARQAAFER